MRWIIIFLFLIPEQVSRESLANTGRQPCSAIKALFIFDKYDFKKSYTQLKRFVLKFEEELQNGSLIYMVTVAKKDSYMGIASDEKLETIIRHESSDRDIIKSETISKAMFDFFDDNENPKLSEQIFLLVNEQSAIDDIKNALIPMSKKKRFIVLYGKHIEGDKWRQLLLDEKHIQELDDIDDNIIKHVQSVRRQSCVDSEYVCDTDEYWNKEKNKCYRCTYICSKTKSISPEKCHYDCPYYFSSENTQGMQGNNRSADHKIYETDDKENHWVITVIVILVILLVILILILACICICYKNIWRDISRFFRKGDDNNHGQAQVEEGMKDHEREQLVICSTIKEKAQSPGNIENQNEDNKTEEDEEAGLVSAVDEGENNRMSAEVFELPCIKPKNKCYVFQDENNKQGEKEVELESDIDEDGIDLRLSEMTELPLAKPNFIHETVINLDEKVKFKVVMS